MIATITGAVIVGGQRYEVQTQITLPDDIPPVMMPDGTERVGNHIARRRGKGKRGEE